jgi:lipopolysaccharide export system permease protein
VSFVFGPLREATMGVRILMGVVVGFVFKFIEDLLAPLSVVFGIEPLVAILVPISLCYLTGTYLLVRSS